MMEPECMDIKEIQQKVGTVWKCLEMPLSHCWRSALSEIHICLPETLEANFVWGESRLMTRIFRFSASLLKYFFKKRRKWEAAIGFKPIRTAPLQLLFMKPTLASKHVSKTDSSFGFVASHKISLQSFRQTNVDLRQCWSPTMRKRHFQTFPNSSHLLLNLFDVHAFRLHHLPVWYAIFLWTKPYIDIDRVLRAFKSLNH